MKECKRCKRLLPDNLFKSKNSYVCLDCRRDYMREYRKNNRAHISAQHSEYMKGYKETHKDELATYHREYARRTLEIQPENFRGPNDGRYKNNKKMKSYLYNVKHYYGLTEEEYNSLPKFCEVCGSTDSRLCIDHDHRTGKVRGVLCLRCNAALGMLRDNPVYIDKLKEYLTRSLTKD